MSMCAQIYSNFKNVNLSYRNKEITNERKIKKRKTRKGVRTIKFQNNLKYNNTIIITADKFKENYIEKILQ